MRVGAWVLAGLMAIFSSMASAQPAPHWVISWAASAQGPYPVGNPSAQPDQRFALPVPEAGARDQTFRLVLRPSIWGSAARLRFTNVFGTRPIVFDGVFLGLQLGGPALVPGTNRAVTFAAKPQLTLAPGESAWSDAIPLGYTGERLAVSFHVAGESGPMTWHAKALTSSYVTPPGAGAKGEREDEAAFPYSTASWFFLDALEMAMRSESYAVVAFGDSITDGTASTMNGDDRWPDVLARRLKAVHGNRIAVVNAGIGGNQVVGPDEYGAAKPFPGGPSALTRLDRDVLGLSGVAVVIWLEGINDFSKNGNRPLDAVIAGMKEGVARLRQARPGIRIIGATLTPALGSSNAAHGFPEQDQKRRALNDFIRSGGLFDGVADFDRATVDPATGGLRPEFIPESTTGGAGDKLHPNRAGYLAMAMAIDLDLMRPK